MHRRNNYLLISRGWDQSASNTLSQTIYTRQKGQRCELAVYTRNSILNTSAYLIRYISTPSTSTIRQVRVLVRVPEPHEFFSHITCREPLEYLFVGGECLRRRGTGGCLACRERVRSGWCRWGRGGSYHVIKGRKLVVRLRSNLDNDWK